MNQKTFEVIVIGGGIIGCMTALFLKQAGYAVAIVERHLIGKQNQGESSWAGGGILFPLLPWDYSQTVNDLCLEGIRCYPQICQLLTEQTKIETEIYTSGLSILASFDLKRAEIWCEQSQFKLEKYTDILHLPEVQQVNPSCLLKALKYYLLLQGIALFENTELLPMLPDRGIWQTKTGECFMADKFILCAGAWTSLLLGEKDIKPIKGQMLLYKGQANKLNHILYQDGYYLIPRLNGHILAGSTLEDVGFDPHPTKDARKSLHQKACQMLPELQDETILKHWCGLRPATSGNMPIVTQHPRYQNLYINAGHFRYGLTMAPACARLLCEKLSAKTFYNAH